MARATKTTHPYNFDVLDHRQFEDLVRQIALRWRPFDHLDPIGHLGSDGGRDVKGFEKVASRRRGEAEVREWAFQIKREKEVGPQKMRDIVAEAVPDPKSAPHGLVVAVAAAVSRKGHDAFYEEAQKRGVKEAVPWDGNALRDQLSKPENFDLPRFYWGTGPALDGTVLVPLPLDRSAGLDVPVIGRDGELAEMRAHAGDIIVVGPPGTGKSRLALELGDVRFVRPRADENNVADSLRRHRPRKIVLDDAGLNLGELDVLLELRRHKYEFDIVATVWPRDLAAVRRVLKGALVVELSLLERLVVDEIVQATGVTRVELRHAILDQAEGRPGWAIALADMTKNEITASQSIRGLVSGAGLMEAIDEYLERTGATSSHALGFLSLMSALGEVGGDELEQLDAYLNISVLERDELIQEAASAGVIEPVGKGGYLVVPASLRFALVAHQFYERQHPWPIDPLLDRFPTHRNAILHAAVTAAGMGSTAARADLERLLPDLNSLYRPTLEQYVALDDDAAQRATRAAVSGELEPYTAQAVLERATRHHLLEDAVMALLDSAVGDDRTEFNNPDHPVRVIGEMGTRVSPHGDSSFDLRAQILQLAARWLDRNPTPERQRVWAKLVPYLLSPTAEGNYTDPGDTMKIHLMGGCETPAHLGKIRDELWPLVAVRLPDLPSAALVPVIEAVEDWARLAEGLPGNYGAKPAKEQAAIGAEMSEIMLRAVRDAADGKPGGQIALKAKSRFYKLNVRQRIDPEFRLLTLEPWRLPGRGKRGQGPLQRLVDATAVAWAREQPDALMRRLANWSEEARRVSRSLHPMINHLMRSLADYVPDADGYIESGLRAGLTGELGMLMEARLARGGRLPRWIHGPLSPAARSTAIEAALRPGASRPAARWALGQLGPDDVGLAEGAMWARDNADWVSHELIRHPVPAIRGAAALLFRLTSRDAERRAAVPPRWRDEWRAAIEVAPAESSHGGDNYRLGIAFDALVDSHPDVVERWLIGHLGNEPDAHWGLIDVPKKVSAVLRKLPRQNRDRLIRCYAHEPFAPALLSELMPDDPAWVGALLDQGVVPMDTVVHALSTGAQHGDKPDIGCLTRLAPVLLPRGLSAEDLAATAIFGTWRGSPSGRSVALTEAFAAAAASDDPHVRNLGSAGAARFGELHASDEAEERRLRVTGRR